MAVGPGAPRGARWARWVASGLAGALVAACAAEGPSRTGDDAIDVRVLVSPTPASTADTRVTVEVTDRGVPATGAEVTLAAESAADRTGGGFEVAREPLEDRGGGRYASSPLAFPAPGAWVLVIDITLGDSRRASIRWPLQVTGPASGG